MGTAIDEVPPGVTCPICWGAGKPFGDVGTPGIVTLTFSGIEAGSGQPAGWPPPPNGSYELSQVSGCGFQYFANDKYIVLDYLVGGTRVFFSWPPYSIVFTKIVGVVCALSLPNGLVEPPNQFWKNGQCNITLGYL